MKVNNNAGTLIKDIKNGEVFFWGVDAYMMTKKNGGKNNCARYAVNLYNGGFGLFDKYSRVFTSPATLTLGSIENEANKPSASTHKTEAKAEVKTKTEAKEFPAKVEQITFEQVNSSESTSHEWLTVPDFAKKRGISSAKAYNILHKSLTNYSKKIWMNGKQVYIVRSDAPVTYLEQVEMEAKEQEARLKAGKWLTVAKFAELAGVTTQAIYDRKNLAQYTKLINGKKYINSAALKSVK